MKKKFLIFTLCFTIVFSSINFNKSYANDIRFADGGVVSAPLVATLCTLGLGVGISFTSNDDIYSLVSMFYERYKDRMDEVNQVFNVAVKIGANKVVSVGKEFYDIAMDFFNSLSFDSDSFGSVNAIGGTFELNKDYLFSELVDFGGEPTVYNDIKVYIPSKDNYYPLALKGSSTNYYFIQLGYYDTSFNSIYTFEARKSSYYNQAFLNFSLLGNSIYEGFYNYDVFLNYGVSTANKSFYLSGLSSVNSVIGTYDDTLFNDNVKDDKIDVYVPGNVGSLVGSVPSDVFVGGNVGSLNPPYDLPVGGVVTVPDVHDPSIDIDDSITIPSIDSPSIDNPFANITEYIISLVVPTDSYWTNTFNDLHNNFVNAFPMVDMSNFNSLIVDGKPFPNIDVNIMGVKGRVVNGDTVNSIVDWLRPIIAGFVCLCLMFFNYRKIYKLIRNSEPFEGIGKVENHAN